jgi:ubiquinone/menaquinone biosynthesis C-methylase UbiE
MWYDSKHVEIRCPKEWYNAVAPQYKQSHRHLNSFYHIEFLRFLPRWKEFRIIDLWAWDGRMFSVLNSIPHTEITACDISEKMLEKYPKWAKKQIVDLEQTFPFDDNSFDLAFCFFTLEHIQNIENFFNETYRILSNDGQIFIWHFFQRREFERTLNQKKFKIQQYKRSTEEIKDIAKNCFFNVEIVLLTDKWVHTWDLIIWKK